jgi:hypothetical protein
MKNMSKKTLGVGLGVFGISIAGAVGLLGSWRGAEAPFLVDEVQASVSEVGVPFISLEEGVFQVNTYVGKVTVSRNGIDYFLSGKDQVVKSFRELPVNGNLSYLTSGEVSGTTVSVFSGDNSEEWQSNLASYESVRYESVWDGVDIEVRAFQDSVEKYFYVTPGAGVSDILMEVSAEELTLDESGNLVVRQGSDDYLMTAPVAWQTIDDERVNVEVEYTLEGAQYGFVVGEYDSRYELVIDPILAGTYLGSDENEFISGEVIEHTPDGGVVIVGSTPGIVAGVPSGGYGTASDGNEDVMVAKFDQDMDLTNIAFLGSAAGTERPTSVTVNRSGDIFMSGVVYAGEAGYPTTSGVFDDFGVNKEGVISRLSSDLSELVASSYIGGIAGDEAWGIEFSEDEDSLYVTGFTSSDLSYDVPGYDQVRNGGGDGYLAHVSLDLSEIYAWTYYGGTGDDNAIGLAIDGDGNPIIVGGTDDVVPTTPGAPQDFNIAGQDGYVARFSADLETLMRATMVGTQDDDIFVDVEVQSDGDVVMAGTVFGSDFSPLPIAAYQDEVFGTFQNGLVYVIEEDFSDAVGATWIGADEDTGDTSLQGIEVDLYDNVWVVGGTDSSTMIVSPDAYQNSLSGGSDGYVLTLNDDVTALVRGTYFGGTGDDEVKSLSLDDGLNPIVVGTTDGTISTTGSSFDQTANGGVDVFVAEFDCQMGSAGSECQDVTPPEPITFSPADGVTDVGLETTVFRIIYDEAIEVEPEDVRLYAEDGTLLETINSLSHPTRVTALGNQLDLVFTQEFTYGASYYIELDQGVVRDVFINPSVAISGADGWSFTIEPNDGVAPVLQSTSPADGAVEVDPLADFVMTFDEAVGFESGTLRVYRASDDQLVETIDVAGFPSSGNGTTTLALDRQETSLEYGTEYYVLADAGVLRDLTGTDFAGITDKDTWAFTTASLDSEEPVSDPESNEGNTDESDGDLDGGDESGESDDPQQDSSDVSVNQDDEARDVSENVVSRPGTGLLASVGGFINPVGLNSVSDNDNETAEDDEGVGVTESENELLLPENSDENSVNRNDDVDTESEVDEEEEDDIQFILWVTLGGLGLFGVLGFVIWKLRK